MPKLSHFDEKGGVVKCPTPWGHWWQTLDEVFVEVIPNSPVRSKEVSIKCTNTEISCAIANKEMFKGKLFDVVHGNEIIWTLENKGTLLNIVLPKAEFKGKEQIWPSLFVNSGENYSADATIFHEMKKKMDLEKFQIENPGFDFSRAKLAKQYDHVKPLPSELDSTG
uniref:NudC domain-containing protein 2 n=1 Tax=Cacopsylla melanoneura TaxID=428564 RepID=A0A8D8RAM9_9HEMI